jgi:hypothetical protein
MLKASLLKACAFAAVATVTLAAGGAAQAAVMAPIVQTAPFVQTTPLVQAPGQAGVTKVYWVWRHHHRFWVPPHRRDWHR